MAKTNLSPFPNIAFNAERLGEILEMIDVDQSVASLMIDQFEPKFSSSGLPDPMLEAIYSDFYYRPVRNIWLLDKLQEKLVRSDNRFLSRDIAGLRQGNFSRWQGLGNFRLDFPPSPSIEDLPQQVAQLIATILPEKFQPDFTGLMIRLIEYWTNHDSTRKLLIIYAIVATVYYLLDYPKVRVSPPSKSLENVERLVFPLTEELGRLESLHLPYHGGISAFRIWALSVILAAMDSENSYALSYPRKYSFGTLEIEFGNFPALRDNRLMPIGDIRRLTFADLAPGKNVVIAFPVIQNILEISPTEISLSSYVPDQVSGQYIRENVVGTISADFSLHQVLREFGIGSTWKVAVYYDV